MRRLAQEPQISESNLDIFKNQLPVFRSSEDNASKNNEDIPQCITLLQNIVSLQPELLIKAQKILDQTEQKQYSKGIGYYNTKNVLMLEYLIQLQFYQLFKINGEDLTQGQGLELYQRLVYLKTLMTKLSPVEKKLEYQKNKLLKYSDVINVKTDKAIEGSGQEQDGEEDEGQDLDSEEQKNGKEQNKLENDSDDQDALMYQPRPQALLKVKKAKKKQQQKEGIYRAPKISAVLSKEDSRKRKAQMQEKRKKVHLINKYRDDLLDEDDAHERGVGSEPSEKIKRKFQEKTDFEESAFVRLPDTKRQKKWKKDLIKKYQRSNPLEDQLKDVEMIKQIFTEKKEELPQKVLKRQKSKHKALPGAKKRKFE